MLRNQAVAVSSPGKSRASGRELHGLFLEVFGLCAALSGVMDTVHERAGMKTPERKFMEFLDHGGPATVPDIAARLGVSRQFVQTTGNGLASRKLVRFSENPRHKRSRLAGLTKEGRAALEKARTNENRIIEQVLPDIDGGQAGQAQHLLMTIRERIGKIQNP